MTIPFEPFRPKSVEPIHLTTRTERRLALAAADYNLFRVPAELVAIDLLTDSGTGPMSTRQWAAMMQGDESYAGSRSYFHLVETCQRLFGFSNILPTHQGRVSERLLVEALIGVRGAGEGLIVPNNAHFDTTRRMIQSSGAEAVNLLATGGDDPDSPPNTAPFKGNIDLQKLQHLLKDRDSAGDIPFVMLTVTCNSNGGQPVSLENIRAVRSLCDRFSKLLILDACRFAENAFFIQQREITERKRTIPSIVREMFDLADGVVMSTRKDGLCNSGGLLMLRNNTLFQKAQRLCVMTEGFQMSYGSLPGRDLEAIAVGLDEVMDETYLASRIAQVARLAQLLHDGGVRIVQPAGGHCVLIDAAHFCPHLSRDDQPAHALTCAMYEHAGIRATRIGSVLRDSNHQPIELVRLAIPRRLYTQSQLDYVAQSIIELKSRATQIEHMQIAAARAAQSPRCEVPLLETV